MPTWAALSAGGIKGLDLPPLPLASEVWIGADNDPAGTGAAYAAAERWMREGRRVRIALPSEGRDFADLLLDEKLETLREEVA
jgi:DNA primase